MVSYRMIGGEVEVLLGSGVATCLTSDHPRDARASASLCGWSGARRPLRRSVGFQECTDSDLCIGFLVGIFECV